MGKNPDQEQVTKGAAKKIIRGLNNNTFGEHLKPKALAAIDALPAVQPVEDPEPSRREQGPDYKAIVKDLKETFYTELGDKSFWLQGDVEDKIEEIEVRHTPGGEGEKERRG